VRIQGNIVKKNTSRFAAKFIQAEYGPTEQRPSAPQFYVYIAYNALSLRTYDNFRPLDFCWTVYKNIVSVQMLRAESAKHSEMRGSPQNCGSSV